jgi:HNH endonuclease
VARTRSIHPKMLTDEAFIGLSAGARVALLGLGTFTDSADRFPWDDAAISAHIGGAAVMSFLPELVASGLVVRAGDVGEVVYHFGFGRRRVSHWERLRRFIFDRDGHACTYCGSSTQPLHCDHVVPASRGGSSEAINLTTACKPCNLSKHDRTPEEWLLSQSR